MPIAFSCPRCGHRMETRREHAGHAGHCTRCGGPIKVPGLSPENVVAGESDRLPAVAFQETPPPTPPAAPRGAGFAPPQAEAPREDTARRLGRFVLEKELGRGGMGVVWKARDEELGRTVAIKTLLESAVDQEGVRRFHREAEALSRLRHPNIVSVYEVGEEEGRHYVVMELVPGATLDRRLAAKRTGAATDEPAKGVAGDHGPLWLAPAKAIEVLRDVATAIGYANEQGVVHRDLKPQNIKDLDGAIADVDRAIELEPRAAVRWSNRAAFRVLKRDYDRAIADASRAIELEPGCAPAFNHRGEARAARGDVRGAVEDYSRAVELDPRLATAWNNRGILRQNRGDLPGAVSDFTRAIEVGPREAGPWNNRGWAHCCQGDFEGAIADLTRALELDPRHAAAWSNRGVSKARHGDVAAAIDDLSHAIEVDPRMPGPWVSRGHARLLKGDREGAAKDFERFLEIAPSHGEAAAVRRKLEEIRGRGP